MGFRHVWYGQRVLLLVGRGANQILANCLGVVVDKDGDVGKSMTSTLIDLGISDVKGSGV